MWSLVVRSVDEELCEYRLKPGLNTIGRGRNNDIVLQDNAASNNHAEIHYDQDNDSLAIRDLDSTNGTFIHSKRISNLQTLHHEDQIRIGFCLITVISSQPNPALHKTINQNIRKEVTNELILESIDNYGFLLVEVGQRLVNVPDLDDALNEISEMTKRIIGAEECQIILADKFDSLSERGIPSSIAQGIIKNRTAITFLHVPENSRNGKEGVTQRAQSMLLAPVMIENDVAALIFAKKPMQAKNTFYNSDLQFALAVGNQVAVSIQRNQVQGILVHNSNHDSLTNLPNRSSFLERLSNSIARNVKQDKNEFAVLFFDIDNFKLINDSFGHGIGDELLIAIANRLNHNVRSIDTVARNSIVARFGGDEFAILLDDIKESRFAIAAAYRLKELMSKPFKINGKEIFTSVSVGVATSTNHYKNPEEILRDADIAMYKAKEHGKDRVEVYDKAMHARVMERMQMGTALKQGVLQKEFQIYYQPIISLKSGRITGHEALLRWHTADHRILTPKDFMDAIDTAGLLYAADHWVLRNACLQAVEWQRMFPSVPPLYISVNMSIKYLKNPNLVENIDQVLRETKLDPNHLWLEITEKVGAANDEPTNSVLNRLHEIGVRISIDDFGTGYSALSYLANFPIDALKIDRSFIKMIGVKQGSQKIIEMIKTLAMHLGLVLIAEGIEDTIQLSFLQSIGCEYAQGFYFSKPLDVKSATQLLVKMNHI